jgi:hypothetical protein
MATGNIWRMFSSNSTFDKLARVRPEARDAETNPYIEGLCVLSSLLSNFASPPADLNDRLAVAQSPDLTDSHVFNGLTLESSIPPRLLRSIDAHQSRIVDIHVSVTGLLKACFDSTELADLHALGGRVAWRRQIPYGTTDTQTRPRSARPPLSCFPS